MSTHKHIDKICVVAVMIAVVISVLLMNVYTFDSQSASVSMGYENRLFSTDRVHTIDIVMNDWESFISTAQSETYSACNVIIDGEVVKNVGIRGKGNTSLSNVASMDSDRYSFKIEFDQYDHTQSYYGLDKLCLNNIIQDNTYMKDYLVYQMMLEYGVDAPLCSYVYITVNGEDWGLYLAVEGVEESFLQRNYGNDYGDLYKPDSNSGMGNNNSSDVKLQYIDDNAESYSNIFDNAKTDVTKADENRLIASLKQLSEYENLEEVLNVDELLRYFVVHNFVVNDDSYTGNMIHNYYLYEKDGKLSMIPWDYNLAFGTFQGGNASSSVNDSIDEVLSDRPMQAWIFSDDTYTQQYYELYANMLEQIDIQAIIDQGYELIASYVEKDPTAFCTYEEFQTGVETLKEFCNLRVESVQSQLSGSEEAVAVNNLVLSDMGTMTNDMQGGKGGRGFADRNTTDKNNQDAEETFAPPSGMEMPEGMEIPEGVEMPENMEMPEGMEKPERLEQPDGMEMPTNSEMQKPSDEGLGNMILLGVSGIVLIFGLIFAFLFKY